MPSTTYNGSPPAEIEATPLTRTIEPEPAIPEPVITCTPAAFPCMAFSKDGVGMSVNSFAFKLTTEPVRSLLRATP